MDIGFHNALKSLYRLYRDSLPLTFFLSIFLGSFGVAGCTDVRNFAGTWSGQILADSQIREGFASEATIDPLFLSQVDLQGIEANLTTNDGQFQNTQLTSVHKFAYDSMASLTFDRAPLRSYLLFAPLTSQPNGWPASVLVSLFGDDHIEVRIFRGNDIFGVFNLHRQE